MVAYCSSWLERYQTLIAGVFAVVAAVITALALYRSASLPLRESRKADKERNAKRLQVARFELKEELQRLRGRALIIKGSITVYHHSKKPVSDSFKDRLYLHEPTLAKERDILSLLDEETLGSFMKLMTDVYSHQQDMQRAGSFVSLDFYRQIVGRLDRIGVRAETLRKSL